MTSETQWGESLAELTAVLVGDFDLAALLHRLAETSASLCAATGAGIVVADQDGVLQDVAYSSEAVRQLERIQLAAGQGPCVDCFREGHPVEEPDMASAAGRWPEFAPEATRRGVLSARALPMRLRGQTVGALNLFHSAPGPCPPQLLRAAQGLADLATMGILTHGYGPRLPELVESHVKPALLERTKIERAKGFLAERGGITMDEAFDRLRDYAERHGTSLVRAAEDISSRSLDANAVLIHATDGVGSHTLNRDPAPVDGRTRQRP